MNNNNSLSLVDKKIDRKIEEWRQRLIDLSRRNRLLYYKKTKSANLTLLIPEFDTVFNRLVLQEKPWKFWLPPLEDEQPEDENSERKQIKSDLKELLKIHPPRQDDLVCNNFNRKELEKILKNLYRKAIIDYRERGIRILYITFGMMKWKETTNDLIYSPLILCPVELKRDTARDPFILSLTEEEIVLNPALQVKLQKDFNIKLPELPEEWDEMTIIEYLDELTDLVKPLTWEIEKTSQIGLFSFHKLVMYNDLLINASYVKANPIIRALGGESINESQINDIPEERELDNIQKPEETYQILDADSSQQQCIQAALKGQSLVLQGPPGTGKSQTIANIIAEFIARGKTVLFVSEKMAALEVVFKRLKEKELGDFCLELHSHKANKREVVSELNRCMDEYLVPKNLPSSIVFEKYNKLREKLNNYVNALHKTREPLGESVYRVLSKLSKLENVPFIHIKLKNANLISPKYIQKIEELVKKLTTVWQVAEEGKEFLWFGCLECEYNTEVKNRWDLLLKELALNITKLISISEQFSEDIDVDISLNFTNIEWLVQIANHLNMNPSPEANWFEYKELDKLLNKTEENRIFFGKYHQIQTNLSQKYDKAFFKISPEITINLTKAWNEIKIILDPGDSIIKRLLIYGDSNEKNLSKLFKILLEFLKNMRQFIKDCLLYIEEISRHFEISIENLTLERMQEIIQLVNLCKSEVKPESNWLNPLQIEEIRELIKQLRPSYEEFNAKKQILLKTYDESFFELDIDKLIENFNSIFYHPALRWLNPGFYRDKKAILRTTNGYKLPRTLLDDLLKGRELLRMHKKLASNQEQVKTLLGKYYKEYDTDFNLIEKALNIAEEAIKLLKIFPLPEGVVKFISFGSFISSDISTLNINIEKALQKWEQNKQELYMLLPEERLPEKDLSSNQSNLLNIDELAESIIIPLEKTYKIIEQLMSYNKDRQLSDIERLLEDLSYNEWLQKVEKHIEVESNSLKQNFGKKYCGINTDWDDISKSLQWTKKMLDLFKNHIITEKFISLITSSDNKMTLNKDLATNYQHTISLFQSFEENFDSPNPTYLGKSYQELSLSELYERIVILQEHMNDLQMWTDFKKLREEFIKVNIGIFLSKLLEDPPDASELLDVYHKTIYQAWLDFIFEKTPVLSEFRGQNHEKVIEEFRKLDKELVYLSGQKIIDLCNSRRPKNILFKAQDSELSILRREAAKKRKHLPIRHLFNRIPNLLLRLKPCLLMSPLSVSQFIQPDIKTEKQILFDDYIQSEVLKFDLVIFDEASQIFTEDVVGAIYRGKQLIVAGDSKQLPPTNFFRTMDNDEDYNEDEIEEETSADFNSVLDECCTILPAPFLKWHYRSKHESLIAFSNNRFYSDRLITFPSLRYKDETLGIKFVYVPDGIYDRGGKRNNVKEAEIVADKVFQHFTNYPNKSLGVVAFSQAQMIAIEDEIEQRRRVKPEFEVFFKEDRLEGFFVKNLENVQGDERDVIIFSIGYGRDQHGRMAMNFGPLNKTGGERRLNVAVTRAREKIILISSIKASDIDLRAAKASGVLNLYHYLNYSEIGENALEITHPQGKGDIESPLEESVAESIKSMGYDVIHQVGCSGYRIDMGVVDPEHYGQFLLGIECDGATYHSAATARDRDRLRQQILEGLGWKIHRIWSTDWVSNRETVVKKLKSIIEKARNDKINSSEKNIIILEEKVKLPEIITKKENNMTERISINNKVEDISLPGTIPYETCNIYPSLWVGKDFHLQEYRLEQCQLIVEMVNKEGPIHIQLVVKRLVTAWGLSRTGNRIMTAVKEAVRYGEINNRFIKRGDFLWPFKMKNTSVRVPIPGVSESFRDIEHIPPEEIQIAIKIIIKHALGIGKESLILETARIFGFNRTSDTIKEYILKEYKFLKKNGIIKENHYSVSLQADS